MQELFVTYTLLIMKKTSEINKGETKCKNHDIKAQIMQHWKSKKC